MDDIRSEFSRFQARKSSETAFAGQLAALQLVCGIDLSSALAAGPEEKARLQHRLRRAIERERLRGMRRHWSYDLNRHIALKQALDRLSEAESVSPSAPEPGRSPSAFGKARASPRSCGGKAGMVHANHNLEDLGRV